MILVHCYYHKPHQEISAKEQREVKTVYQIHCVLVLSIYVYMKIHKYKFTLFLHVHFITSVSSDKIVLQVHSGMPHTKRTNLPQIQLKSPSLQINIYHAIVKKTQANNEILLTARRQKARNCRVVT